jgi:hypothetical protein
MERQAATNIAFIVPLVLRHEFDTTGPAAMAG